MTGQDYIDVIRAAAATANRDMWWASSRKQQLALIILFDEFAKEENVSQRFAANEKPGDWFRHRCLELLFGVTSSTKLSCGQIGTLLTEFGTKNGGEWHLTPRGLDGLRTLADELARTEPTQISLL